MDKQILINQKLPCDKCLDAWKQHYQVNFKCDYGHSTDCWKAILDEKFNKDNVIDTEKYEENSQH